MRRETKKEGRHFAMSTREGSVISTLTAANNSLPKAEQKVQGAHSPEIVQESYLLLDDADAWAVWASAHPDWAL
jgi:hypothetical protein